MIDPKAFAVGMHALCVAFNREATPDLRDVYAVALSDLSTSQFTAAVAAVIEGERFFPAPAVLREAASRMRRPEYLALPPARTEEQKRLDREASRRGLELVRGAYRERVKALPPTPVATAPDPVTVVATDERLAALRRQAAELVEQEQPAGAGEGGV